SLRSNLRRFLFSRTAGMRRRMVLRPLSMEEVMAERTVTREHTGPTTGIDIRSGLKKKIRIFCNPRMMDSLNDKAARKTFCFIQVHINPYVPVYIDRIQLRFFAFLFKCVTSSNRS
ncbi:hypothetical protein M8C21_026561, partial [Ambrosia artemisiifolia]